MGEDTLEVERLLAERDRLLAEADNERASAARARERAEAAETEVHELRAQLAAERERAYREAEAQWAQTLAEAREEVRSVIRRLKESGKTDEADRALAELDMAFRERAPEMAEHPSGGAVEVPTEIRVGDHGRLDPFRKAGRVVSVDRDRGEIAMDIAGKQVTGRLANFRLTQRAAERAEGPAPASRRGPELPASTQLDLRGQRRDEALANLQHFLDNAHGSGLGQVTILHGKGMGVLSEAVRAALKEDPRVARFGYARPEAGGAGVTEVELQTGGGSA